MTMINQLTHFEPAHVALRDERLRVNQRQRLQILCAVGEDVVHSSCSGTQPIELTVGRAET
jgi:hypothetical protein